MWPVLSIFLCLFAVWFLSRVDITKALYPSGLRKSIISTLSVGSTPRLAFRALRNGADLGDKFDGVVADTPLFISDATGTTVLGNELGDFLNEQPKILRTRSNLSNPICYFAKRCCDYLISFILLLILIVPILVICCIIRVTSKGPALFEHERQGESGKPFKCLKFRTMHIDAEYKIQEILDTDPEAKAEWEEYRKLRDDPRITKLGRVLRRTSLDELPQLFNVLRGEMSLVGPRPVTKDEIDQYYKDTAELCFSIPPGITGLWQVNGRNTSSYEQRISFDFWYLRNWSPLLDFLILLKTIPVVIKGEGAH
jgi:Undecaprenyl-phosphate galactose phosphotransferase WbaP